MWTYDDIKKDIDGSRKIIDLEKNIHKKELYKYILDKTEEEIFCTMTDSLLPNDTLKSSMFNLKNSYIANNRYYEIINKFGNIIKQNEKLFDECFNIYCNLDDIEYANISNRQCIDMVSSIFLNMDNKFSKLYSEFYKNIYSSVRFTNDDNELHGIDGFCIYIGLLDKSYILVRDDIGVAKPISLAHECGHMLSYKFNAEKSYKRKDEFLTEVSSLFFEMIYTYENAYNYDSLNTSLFNLEKYYFMLSECNKLLFHKYIIDEWTSNNYEINKILYSNIKNKNNINRKEFIDIVRSNIDFNGKYIIGYVVALYLLHIYKEDKNSAFMLLRIMLNLQDNDTYLSINNLIDYNYVNDELDIMLKTIFKDVQKKLTLR